MSSLNKNLLYFFCYHIIGAVLLVLFGGAGSDIVYLVLMITIMFIHLLTLVVHTVLSRNSPSSFREKLTNFVVLILLILVYYSSIEIIVEYLFRLNQLTLIIK